MSSSRKYHDQAHGKKRRHRDVDSDSEGRPERSTRRREQRKNNERDALADFREQITDGESVYPRRDREADSAHSSEIRYRGHKSSQDSHRRDPDDGYRSRKSREHPSETRRGSDRYAHETPHRRGDEYDKRPSGRHSRLDENKDEDEYRSRGKGREKDGSSGDRFKYHTYGHRDDERRGRSPSKSSSTRSRSYSDRSLSPRSSSRESYRRHRKNKRRRSRSGSHSVDDRKGRRHRHSSSQKTGRYKNKDETDPKRSVLTGKKIKLKVKKDRGDDERDAKREELLKFLNSAYE